jgi:hypothetical protein
MLGTGYSLFGLQPLVCPRRRAEGLNVNSPESNLVALNLNDYLGGWARITVGLVLSLLGAALALGGPRGIAVPGVGVILLGLGLAWRGLGVLTERVFLASDHIAYVTALSGCMIPWHQVELYSAGFTAGIRRCHAIFRLDGVSKRIRFCTRPEEHGNLDALLRDRCSQAFLHDQASGWITPPPIADAYAARARERFRRIARRVSRRHLLLAVGQVIMLPVMVVLAIVGFIASHCHAFPLFYGPSEIAANFRRAANARRSFTHFRMEGGSP